MNKKSVVILGGGYTGTTAAIDLARHSPSSLDLVVVEPRKQIGRGVAYSARHRDHRLNAPSGIHFVVPEEPGALDNWFHDNVELEGDPEARAFDGSLFIRRSDFGAYVLHEFERHRADNPSGSSLRHLQGMAVDVTRNDGHESPGFEVTLADGERLRGDAVLVTTGNDQPSVPFPFSGALEHHSAFLANPWDIDALEAMPAEARVLIVGTGLTAADVIAALKRQNHRGLITSLSRRGLRPNSRPRSHADLPQPFWERVHMDPSLFSAKHGKLSTVRDVFRAVRRDAAAAVAEGLPWQTAFDDLRDSVREVWLGLPIAEKQRFMRHARAYYDVHRFRYPPQTDEQLLQAEDDGILERRTGRLLAAVDRGARLEVQWQDRATRKVITDQFDAVINCVGPETRPRKTRNPLLHALLDRGLARTPSLGMGLDVDEDCRALDREGQCVNSLFVLGPLTFATFGYSLGAPFIVAQIRAALPGIFQDLGLG